MSDSINNDNVFSSDHIPWKVRHRDMHLEPLTEEEIEYEAKVQVLHSAYNILHCCCPKCGGNRMRRTLIGYHPYVPENDPNRHGCMNCDWTGKRSELVAFPK